MLDLTTRDIKFLPGVGEQRATLLGRELGIRSLYDLLYYFPYKYIDRSRVFKVSELGGQLQHVQLLGEIRSFEEMGEGASRRLVGHFTDGTAFVDLVWFRGIKFVKNKLKLNTRYVVFGKPSVFNGRVNIAHPDVDDASLLKLDTMGLQPYYNTTEKMKRSGLNSNAMLKLVQNLLEQLKYPLPETLSPDIVQKNGLMSLDDALRIVHFPRNPKELQLAQYRLKFEELFFIQLNILHYSRERQTRYVGHRFAKVGEMFNRFYNEQLPFQLTNAQKRVVKEIRADVNSDRQMNRLLQGDVGSGKTMVAVLTALIAIGNGYQACIMAPTEVLAQQHFKNIQKFLAPTGVKSALLTGSTKTSERREVHAGLEDGSIGIIVGTHALIEDNVVFRNLGLAIIDEQHRFGVEQRSKLWRKTSAGAPPHVLVMTATPIPRTLAMTLYGDLDVSVIDELPPGRKPVQTIHTTEGKRPALYNFMKEQIRQGRQVFVVYPLINETEKLDYQSLEAGAEDIMNKFPFPEYKTAVVHGKQLNDVKKFNMDAFAAGRADILVATSVIEVGVDVPNASVMVIESAERFGLSQLHQLRGRVGRGSEKSYCVLMTGHKLSKESKHRIELMCATENGFELAEEDMKMRGPGDLEGTQQSGLPISLNIASLAKDGLILNAARECADAVLREDPTLSLLKNQPLKDELRKDKYQIKDYSKIS